MDENTSYPKSTSGTPVALEQRDMATDGRRFSPSVGRNKDVVRDAFLSIVDDGSRVLEVASGTGEHGAHIVSATRSLTWTYSDIDPDSMTSQSAWVEHMKSSRLQGPLYLDTNSSWESIRESAAFDAIFCANMIHIAPFGAAEGLLKGAGRLLRDGGTLCLYGPFARDGEITPSNLRFSADLKRRDSRWGVRDLEREIVPLGNNNGLKLSRTIDMPANNLCAVFTKVNL